MTFIKYNHVYGELILKGINGAVLYQKNNGRNGSYVFVPKRGHPTIDTKKNCISMITNKRVKK